MSTSPLMRRAALSAALVLPAVPAPGAAPSPAREVRVLMGTTAEVQAGGLADPLPAIGGAFAAMARVDDSMSLWKPSELTRINDAGGGAVSADLYRVLVCALDVARASSGAFDPTVEPLVRATGGLGGRRRKLPDRERRELLARVGYMKVRLDEKGRSVVLAGARLDLGGIAKGYAVDLAMEALRSAGATVGLADLGGSSTCAFGIPLDIALRHEEAAEKEERRGEPWARFRLSQKCLSTSGGGEKPDHIFDPRTGEPARPVLTATVLADTAMEADALSTAVFVLGPDEGLRLLADRGASGFVLVRERRRRVIRATAGFAEEHRLESHGIPVREEAVGEPAPGP